LFLTPVSLSVMRIKNAMIKFNHIHLNFNGKIIIQNLSFEVKHGEKVVLIGKSGSGKSSLLGLLLGFIEPSKGKIFFEGIRVDKKSAWYVRKKVAYIDQDVSIGDGKVLDLLNFVSKLKTNKSLDFNISKVNGLFCDFELSNDTINQDLENLSGGERQRLAIVISILLERNIFLLDEVTSSLDKPLKKKVTDYFVERENCTCLVISHDSIWLDNPAVKVFDVEEGKWR